MEGAKRLRRRGIKASFQRGWMTLFWISGLLLLCCQESFYTASLTDLLLVLVWFFFVCEDWEQHDKATAQHRQQHRALLFVPRLFLTACKLNFPIYDGNQLHRRFVAHLQNHV